MNDSTVPPPCSGSDDDRRSLFTWLSVGLSAFIGMVITLPGIGFVLAPVFRQPPRKWRSVGKVADFPLNKTMLVNYEDPSPEIWAGVTAKTGSWVRRIGEKQFITFSINCRHLGCPVRWEEDANLFMCPCHGGVYYPDGEVAAGPPPQPLDRYEWRIQGEELQILTGPIPLTTFEKSLT